MALLEGTVVDEAGIAAGTRVGWVATGVFVLTIVALWLLQHPYAGLEHDARIYLLLALNVLHPESYSADVLVAYGSQGAYTIYPRIAAWAIDAAGGAAPGMLATWIGSYALFATGLIALGRALWPAPWRLLAVALVLVIPGDYGVEGHLSYGEAIATSRPAAEGLVLLALAGWLSGRKSAALVSMALAVPMHPLVATPGVLLLLLMSLPARAFWPGALALLAAGPAVLLLATAGAPWPFGEVDAAWLELIRQRTPYLFPDEWNTADWGRALVPLGWLALALAVHRREEPVATLVLAAMIVAMAGLLTAIVSAFEPMVIVVQGQPWRWVWVGKLLAVAAAPATIARLWSSGTAGRVAVLLAIAGWVSRDVGGAALLVIAISVWLMRDRLSARSLRPLTVAATLFLAAVSCWAILGAGFGIRGGLEFVNDASLPRWAYTLTSDGLLPAAAVVLSWRLAYVAPRQAGAVAIAMLSSVAAIPAASALGAATTTVEARGSDPEAWHRGIPANASVYWPGHPVETWLLLRRASYLSETQATAILFSRTAALEVARRAGFADALHEGKSVLNWRDGPVKPYRFSTEAVAAACADPGLDFLVARVATGADPMPFSCISPGTTGGHCMVDCAAVRSAGGPPA